MAKQFEFSWDDVKKDVKEAKNWKYHKKELEAIFHKHNDNKPYACRCAECVEYRKIYFNS